MSADENSIPPDDEPLTDEQKKAAEEKQAAKEKKAAAYKAHKDRAAQKQKENTLAGQNIGDLPPIKDPIRRRDCLADFELFCKTYGKAAFYLPWAETHKVSAYKIQKSAEHGGWHAYGEPRGSGKTTRATWGGVWAILAGLHLYIPIIGANKGMAVGLVDAIKTLLQHNDLLLEDFPHVCFPIRCLEGEPRKAKGQRYKDKLTEIDWSEQRIALPWIPDDNNPCAGAVIESYGLESAIRGLNYAMPDGRIIRPSFAIADDPQTRESARSPSQTRTRLEILTGDVGYLSGPDKAMSIVCPCTIIYEGDLASQILDRKEHPEWNGETTRMVISFPTNQKLWDEYSEIHRASSGEDWTSEASTAFYRENQVAMDEGAEVYWKERFKEGEISAIQSAMNFKIRDEGTFWAECQNEPVVRQDELQVLSVDELCHKITGFGRGIVPANCTALTAFTDIQLDHFFWMVCAWTPDFTGYVIDYGGWPLQGVNYFTRRGIRIKLSMVYPGDEAAITHAALTDIGDKVISKNYMTTDGRKMTVDRWCIDGGYHVRVPATETFIAQSALKKRIAITKGIGVKAKERPLSLNNLALKQRRGPWEWYWKSNQNNGGWIYFNTNFWKHRIHNALLQPLNNSGSIQLFNGGPAVHRMLAEHILAEKADKVEAKGNIAYEFTEIPNRDNEGLDSIVGCMLGAQTLGITSQSERSVVKSKPRSSLAAMQNRAKKKQ